jgi:hypothetical protein
MCHIGNKNLLCVNVHICNDINTRQEVEKITITFLCFRMKPFINFSNYQLKINYDYNFYDIE